jgi:hypothetical protein
MVLKIYLTDGTVVAILLAQYETSAEPLRLHNYNVSLQVLFNGLPTIHVHVR